MASTRGAAGSGGTAPAIRVRDAELADLDAIMALETATFPGDAWSRDLMAAELASPHTVYVVVESGDEVVAYAGLSAPAGAGQGDIQTIAVDPTHRRLGIGTVLMQQLLGAARARGASEVFLEVRADNPGAEELYRRHGFVRIGVRPHYYQPDDVDAIVMRWEGEG
ncbi:ribosomal protein S18-alanine N-acetyltransferase [Yonghaparkia sp. Soil809]|uniref:ribosomal protein S18-alanine N-acetyltransferase n=1 Tax=Yonghaparkia sp. Soil809 TaxID=1736417 RepID=UPI0006F9852F|nr:ribosomal protein S18-alanine N-acetyltransferase [Yonghaparkia sp. Soil809]KRF33047.1 ribosomal-protein-alanine acetyltransferase [Yonghaparkia sp. Soil809]